MEVREVVAAARARWWVLVLGLLVGVGCAISVIVLSTPLYTAQTQLFVSTTQSTTTSDVFQGGQFSQQRVTSYAQLLTGRELASRVIARLRLPMSAKDLADEVSATAVTDTVLLDVTVTDALPGRAQAIAQAIGAEFPRMVSQLEASDQSGVSPVKVTVTQSPTLPTVPSSPRRALDIGLGALAGLIVGILTAITLNRLDRSVRDAGQASQLAQAPIIGTVLRDDALARQHTLDRTDTSRTAEDYRQLRTNLQFLRVDNPPKVIMVSSAAPSEGKTTLVINLALALSEIGKRVTVVEADLRRPKVTRYLGMVAGVGLTNLLAGTAEPKEVSQVFRDGMTVIAAGPIPPNPGELLASSHMGTTLEKLRAENDFVLIDAPPLLPVADASGLAAHTDGVLLSARYGSTRKDQLAQAAMTLQRVGAEVLGVVLNIVPAKAGLAAAYGYGYTYDSDGDGGRGSHRRDQ